MNNSNCIFVILYYIVCCIYNVLCALYHVFSVIDICIS